MENADNLPSFNPIRLLQLIKLLLLNFPWGSENTFGVWALLWGPLPKSSIWSDPISPDWAHQRLQLLAFLKDVFTGGSWDESGMKAVCRVAWLTGFCYVDRSFASLLWGWAISCFIALEMHHEDGRCMEFWKKGLLRSLPSWWCDIMFPLLEYSLWFPTCFWLPLFPETVYIIKLVWIIET